MRLAPALPAGCPWSGFTPPNIDWCEREVCGWIVNPADTWSNLAYLLGALAMWLMRDPPRMRDHRTSRAEHSSRPLSDLRSASPRLPARSSARGDLAHFAPASLAVGVFSFAYHASYTWLLQFFDFVGMFVFCFLVLARNAVRLGWIAPRRERAAWLAGTLAASACVPPLFYAGIPIQATVFVLILASVAQELALFRRERPAAYASYWTALALLAAASAFSLADVTRAWCDPESWLQGHALWHVLSAAALVSLQRFYAAQTRA